jgi:single-strand DNA-binding protein
MAVSSNSYNKTIIIGRLGHDPELKQGPNAQYTRFSICHQSVTKDGHEETQWHKVCAFGKQATICHNYLHKGDLCCIEGHLDARSYEKNGEKRVSNDIIAERITFLSTKRRSDGVKKERVEDELSVMDY